MPLFPARSCRTGSGMDCRTERRTFMGFFCTSRQIRKYEARRFSCLSGSCFRLRTLFFLLLLSAGTFAQAVQAGSGVKTVPTRPPSPPELQSSGYDASRESGFAKAAATSLPGKPENRKEAVFPGPGASGTFAARALRVLVPISIAGVAITVLLLLFNRRLQQEIRERKRSEAALRENERRLLDIIEFLPDPTFVVDRNHRVIAWNSAIEEITGISKTEILGKGGFAYAVPFHGKPRPVLVDLIMDRQVDPKSLYPDIEKRNERLQAEFFLPHLYPGRGAYVMATASPLYDRKGDVVGAIESVRDVTDRWSAENALKESEEKYRGVLESIAEGYFEVDLSGNLTFFNSALCDISGYRAGELSGMNYRQYTSAETAGRLYRIFSGVYESGKTSRITDYEIIRKDGGTRHIEFSVRLTVDEQGNPSGFRGVARDITERRRTEEALKESRDLFDTFMKNLPALAFMKDEEGRYLYLNEAARSFYNEARLSCIGRTDEEIWPPETARRLRENDLAAMKSNVGSSWVETMEIAGVERHFLVSKFPIVRERGPRIIAGIALDMTESIRSEQEKKELQARLLRAQKMEAVGNLAGGIAHDFNNILAAILGHTDLGLLMVPEGLPVRRHLEGVRQAGCRARDLVQQILSFSRQGAHGKKPVQIVPILREGLKLLKASLPSTIEIRGRFDPDMPAIEADATQIHQVLMNLCTNAAHAMEKRGGVLTVSLSRVPSEKVPSGNLPAAGDDWLCLTVADTGAGIAPEHLDRIFEPYFTTKEKGKGTGLGLAVVHGIVESHGGAVEVRSEPGKGTRFVLYFPSIDAAEEQDEAAGAEFPSGTGRILLVDDEKELVDIESQMLRRLGYTVTGACGAEEALECFRRRPASFDLVVTDMTMPQMTGDRLAAALLRIRPDLPIILCTGYSELIDEERAEKIGLSGFLTKPVTLQDFGDCIRQALDRPPAE